MISLLSKYGRYAQTALYVAAIIVALLGQAVAQSLSPQTKKLFDAVLSGKLAQVQMSIAAGGDINAINSWGITPVDLAVDKGYFDIVHFLLQIRDVQAKKPRPAPPPTLASVKSFNGPTATATPPAAPVAEVISPPADAGPWSATIMKSEPLPPELPAGPSPFDQDASNIAALPIIGEVRGPVGSSTTPDSGIQDAVEDTFKKLVIKPQPHLQPQTKPALAAAPPPVANKPVLKKHLTPSKVIAAPRPIVPAPAQNKDNVKTRQIASLSQPPAAPLKPKMPSPPTAPVSPPNVSGPPPPIDANILPQKVKTAPLASVSSDEQPSPVAALNTEDQQKPESNQTALAKVTRIAKPETRKPTPTFESSTPKPVVMLGTTTPPGKPRSTEGFFSKMMAVFSPEEEAKKADKKTPLANKGTPQESGDWTVTNVQQAQLVPRKPTKKVVRELPENRLNGVILSLGRTTALGKSPPPQAPAPWYYKSCIDKRLGSTVFCIETLDWPAEVSPYFLTDSILYEGTKTIVRYDEGAASYYHTLFPSGSYASVVEFFTRRYGPPTQKLKRSIAPLAEPRRINPTVIWQSVAPVTNLLTTLEIRMFDDNRGSFPDTRRGAVYLYHEWSQPVFPQLSSVELMLLRAQVKQR